MPGIQTVRLTGRNREGLGSFGVFLVWDDWRDDLLLGLWPKRGQLVAS